jgi:hypothetical protein
LGGDPVASTSAVMSPDDPTRPVKRRRDNTALSVSSPSLPSSRANSSQNTLASLPCDILLRIAEVLLPRLSPYHENGGGGPSPSSSWIDPGIDIINFSSSCRAIWLAVRGLVGRRFGIATDGNAGGIEILARLASITGLGEEGGLPPPEEDDVENAEFAAEEGKELVEEELNWDQDINDYSSRFRRAMHKIAGARIRHFSIHTRVNPQAVYFQGTSLARAIRSMPRLESFALVHTSEDEVISTSPYTVAVVGHDVLDALASRPDLREIYLCGVKISFQTHAGVQHDTFSTFGPKLTTLTINASHDSALELVKVAPALKEVKVWRDFARSPRIEAEGWWDEKVWKTVEHAELRGFSGTHGRELHDGWKAPLLVCL